MILVEVDMPSLRSSYDFKLDSSATIDSLIDEICKIVCQKEKREVIVRTRDMMLAVISKGIIMNNTFSLKDYNVMNGTKLLLI